MVRNAWAYWSLTQKAQGHRLLKTLMSPHSTFLSDQASQSACLIQFCSPSYKTTQHWHSKLQAHHQRLSDALADPA